MPRLEDVGYANTELILYSKTADILSNCKQHRRITSTYKTFVELFVCLQLWGCKSTAHSQMIIPYHTNIQLCNNIGEQ